MRLVPITALCVLVGLTAGCAFDAAPLQDGQDAQDQTDAPTDTSPPQDIAQEDTPAPPTDVAQDIPIIPGDTSPEQDVEEDASSIDLLEETCHQACQYTLDCLGEICPMGIFGDVDGTIENCTERCIASQPDVSDIQEDTLDAACDEISRRACRNDADLANACECAPLFPQPNVGDPCENNDDCEGPAAACAGNFPGGYCTSIGCEGHLDCGPNNWCLSTNETGTACFQGCNDDPGVCRDGYTCWVLTDNVEACLPQCDTDDECSNGRTCTDGACR